MKKRKRIALLVPRLGPPINLRPAGAHADAKIYDRAKIKAALRAESKRGFDRLGANGSDGFFQ